MAHNDSSPESGSLTGKVAVVIGGGKGMGRAAAQELAAQGAHVVVAARTDADVEAVVEQIMANGGQATSQIMDVTSPAEVDRLASTIRERFGKVHILVNSAGAALIASLDETSEANWDRLINTNLKGPYLSTRAMLDLLRAADGALIVNIASKVGLTGHAMVTAYTASKAGLIGFGRALAQELGTDNIRVVTLCPGPVDTPMRWEATPDMNPNMVISADAVAELILMLARFENRVTTREIVVEALAYDENAAKLE